MIRSWSHSKLVDFEQCKFKAYLKHDQRIPEPERPLPPGKTEHANDRGTRIHQLAEDFVRKGGKVPHELIRFEKEFLQLRKLFSAGVVSLEGEWGMNRAWEPTDWKTAWHRAKLDTLVFIDGVTAVTIDYKSGKKFGNELKHAEQLRLYALNAFLRYPDLQLVHTELWYLDLDEYTLLTLRRDQALHLRKGFDRRGEALTSCEEFPPNPNKFSCKYCPYGPWGTEHCKVGVK